MKGLFEYCVRCGRKLHDEKSQRLGMGRKCSVMSGSRKVLEIIERARQPEFFEERSNGQA